MEGIHKYTARYFYAEATFNCRFVSQNQYFFIFGKLACVDYVYARYFTIK